MRGLAALWLLLVAPGLTWAQASSQKPDFSLSTSGVELSALREARYVRSTKGRRLIDSFIHGSMANALPQAVGAQCWYPARQVIAMAGDGGLAMLMGDLLTLAQYDLPVKIVAFNNSALGSVKLEMKVAGLPDYQTDLKNPNFAKLAEVIGMMGIRIENPADVSAGPNRVLQNSGPALIDLVTDPNAISLPFHIEPGMAAGFGLTTG